MRITRVETYDLRFPTSRELAGSDAMNADPDYAAAYVVVRTDVDGLAGHGFTFTIGRGNEIVLGAIRALQHLLLDESAERLFEDLGGLWRRVVGDSQIRWLGPEKGVVHLAAAALINAVWDLYAKSLGKPLWQLLVDLDPEQLVDCIDFRHISDALPRSEALELLRDGRQGVRERTAKLQTEGYPAYTTSAGWLGYSDDRLRELARKAVDDGFDHVKQKVGTNLHDDLRRAAVLRTEIGPERKLMMDANQVWDVDEAIVKMRRLGEFDPWWIEEPTSPDDILGHARIAREIAPIGVATGEHAHNRVMFKQLLQAEAMSFCQIDACRLAGVNEVLAVLLLAHRFGVPVCPHAGGVGLCELVQHLSMFDFLAVSRSMDGRVIEFVDHLHEHFLDPVRIERGRYLVPTKPGYSAEMRPEALATYSWPDGSYWRNECGREDVGEP